jgi:hypothetical protein
MLRPLRALALLALIVASFARLSAAEAAAPAHQAMMTAGHCAEMPAPTPDDPAKMSVDCMIACAAVAPPAYAEVAAGAPRAAMIEATPPVRIIGIHTATDPPPPRLR